MSKLIEESLQIKKLGEFSRKERPANSKTLSALHQWWARRPLSLSRAIIASCLIEGPKNSEDRKDLHKLL